MYIHLTPSYNIHNTYYYVLFIVIYTTTRDISNVIVKIILQLIVAVEFLR